MSPDVTPHFFIEMFGAAITVLILTAITSGCGGACSGSPPTRCRQYTRWPATPGCRASWRTEGYPGHPDPA